MMGMRLFAAAIIVYRKFSTKSIGKISYESPKKVYKSRKKKSYDDNNNKPKWTDQQEKIIDAVKRHKSVFITGSAGTGKTFLLNHIIKLLRKQYKPSQVFVTGSTGVVACAIRGQTLHSFAGIHSQKCDKEDMLRCVLLNRKASSRFRTAKALVIDEISMVDAQLFENLEFVARKIRGDDSSWGGIQLVVSGDFFQLPPVKSKRIGDDDDDKQFAFEADCWDSSFALQVELTKVYRQSDPQFIKFLQNIRIGKLGEEEEEYFKRLQSSAAMDSKAMLAVQVYPMNKDVSRVNEERMKSLGDEAFVFKAIDSGSDIKRCRKQLDQATPSELSLCLGARVMLTKNLNTWRNFVNGATGEIVDFSRIDAVGVGDEDKDEDEDIDTDSSTEEKDIATICQDGLLPVVKFDSGKTKVIEPVTWQVKDGDNIVAERKQLPLTLAWATSIHKCQGKTIDFIKADLSNAFEYGMHYVVMSRAKSPEGLFITGLDPAKIKAHPKVLCFHEKKLASEKDEKPEEDSTTAPLAVSRTKFHFSLSEFLQNRP
ncbi:hypothetical protein CsatA_017510 [Cannabis sativa]